MRIGMLFNPRAFWVGGHYSRHNKRLCVNLVPMVTFWFVLKGGNIPGSYLEPTALDALFQLFN